MSSLFASALYVLSVSMKNVGYGRVYTIVLLSAVQVQGCFIRCTVYVLLFKGDHQNFWSKIKVTETEINFFKFATLQDTFNSF